MASRPFFVMIMSYDPPAEIHFEFSRVAYNLEYEYLEFEKFNLEKFNLEKWGTKS